MDWSALSQQWPALAVLIGFIGLLLRTLQALYQDQIRDLRADRDAWREIAERGAWLAERGTHIAERSHEGHPPREVPR